MATSLITNPDYILRPDALELRPGPLIERDDFHLSMRGEREYVLRMPTETGMRRWTITSKNNERYLELGIILAMIRLHGFATTWQVQQRITWGLRRMHVITGVLSVALFIGGERLLGSSGLISAVAFSLFLPSLISGVTAWMAGRRILVWTAALNDPQTIIGQRQWLLLPHKPPRQPSAASAPSPSSEDSERSGNPFAA